MTRLVTVAMGLSLVAASGCTNIGDPATPCASMDLGRAAPGTFVTRATAPIVAVTSEQPFILHEVCETVDGVDACNLRRDALEGLSPSSPVLLTATGNYAVAVDAESGIARSYQIFNRPDDEGHTIVALSATSADEGPKTLVAGMRNSDTIVTRDKSGHLARYEPGAGKAEAIDRGRDLLVVAVGEEFVVGREIHSGGKESLYLVGVTKEHRLDRPVKLATGPSFSRVILTPDDERVVATSGSGDDAETLVFAVPSGHVVDRFAGAAVSGRKSGEEMPGLRGVSPDGSHVAYRTPTGALAMRSLDAHASCLVRSATAGDHEVAGFAANGVLYMEASEGIAKTRVLAFDPISREIAALGDAAEGYHLAAVAAEMPGEPDDADTYEREGLRFWALGVRQGSYAAIQPGHEAQPLGLNEVSFMARDDGAVWLLDTARGDNGRRSLSVRRIAPQTEGQALRFARAKDSGPTWMDDDDQLHADFETSLDGAHDICASTGIPGAWAYRCSDGRHGQTFFSTDAGDSERPQQAPDPVEPSPPAP